MARFEEDREDLLAEATALVERVELIADFWPEPIVIGFRRDGAASFYFGADPVYHFNTPGEFRRAFVEGKLYKAVSGTLASLQRFRTEQESQLVRHDLSILETNAVLSAATDRLHRLSSNLTSQQFTIQRQVPAGAELIARVLAWLNGLPNPLQVADSPRVGG